MFDFTFFLTDSHAIMLALALIAALAVLCLYYGFFHFRLGIWHRKGIVAEGSSSDTKLPPVSVVLTAQIQQDMTLVAVEDDIVFHLHGQHLREPLQLLEIVDEEDLTSYHRGGFFTTDGGYAI